jgi:hypothetical protein
VSYVGCSCHVLYLPPRVTWRPRASVHQWREAAVIFLRIKAVSFVLDSDLPVSYSIVSRCI